MFKAKLIKDQRYYRFRQSGIFLLIGGLFSGFIVNVNQYPLWITILVIVVFITYGIYAFRKLKKVKTFIDESILELSGDELRIISPDKTTSKKLNVNTLDDIQFLESYEIPEDSWRSMVNEYLGKYRKNYLITEQDNKTTRYDFVLSSYYMINQLEKVIEDWTVKGYPVRRI